MQSWVRITVILSIYGFFREFRPSEPFISDFLLGEWRNITKEQLHNDVHTIGTYTYITALILVVLVTDLMRFKPVILISAISGIIEYAILLWTTSLLWVQIAQYFQGLYMAAEVAYFTYVYAKVDPSVFLQVTSYIRIAALISHFIASVYAQFLIHYKMMNYRELNYITFLAQVISTFWAFILPSVQYSLYFKRDKSPGSVRMNMLEATNTIVHHTRQFVTEPHMVAWAILYALSVALFMEVQLYTQLLWKHMQEDNEMPESYNGAVEAIQTLLGVVGAFLASLHASTLVVVPIMVGMSVAVFMATFDGNIYVSYLGYILLGMLYHYIITVASANIARRIHTCFGLIFGISMFIATGMQAFFTIVLVQALKLQIVTMFYSIGGLHMIAATGWMIGWTVNRFRKKGTMQLGNKFDMNSLRSPTIQNAKTKQGASDTSCSPTRRMVCHISGRVCFSFRYDFTVGFPRAACR